MIRTRDFLLFLIAVVFLVLAIGVEFINSISAQRINYEPRKFLAVDDTPESYLAEVASAPESVSRADKLANLRKILAEQKTTISAPSPTDTVEPSTITTPVATSTIVTTDIQLCNNYRPTFVPWTTEKIQNEEREGVRVFYSMEPTVSNGTSSTPTLNETVMAVLPIRDTPLAKPNCIVGDVVGIALDGSLIRNNEQKLYGIFGENTQIGYALDGFPIYGSAPEIKTDSCGGIVVNGTYRYYISKERTGILGCFSGIPAKL
jgi:hypothetical protein